MSSAESGVALVEAEEVEDAAMLVRLSVLVEAVRDENRDEVVESVLVAVDAVDVEVGGGPPAPCGPCPPCAPFVCMVSCDPEVELVRSES
ncbi:hypothetical protein [Lichenifustis flavocetrariae]|uniref:Uncharacterized protein n=1 Tax=Lichenifustis flavocetrariae TaxID=2949735 RepID=A0AA42CQ35_9HYPH|nr:hypothetical protein [Lichenifustis flavocetrariae]MCW6511060.1 hypothetical protein [Lichenifustis flavocetrariae]